MAKGISQRKDGARRRNAYNVTEEHESTEPLLPQQGDEPIDESGVPTSGSFEDIWQSLAARLTSCATHLCQYIAWLLGALNQEQLTPEQQASLAALRERLDAKFDHGDASHEAALIELWRACFPGEEWPPSGTSERWKDAGFQGTDPGTDFRGGGLYALKNLLHLARLHPDTFHRLLHKTQGQRQDLEYPFCAAGINITFKLEELLELRVRGARSEAPPSQAAGKAFAAVAAVRPDAFEEVYVAAFETLDDEWLARGATYMEFPAVLDATMARMAAALRRRPASVHDLRGMLGLA